MLIRRLDRDHPPANWNGPHVGLRLVEAFETLALVPLHFGPSPLVRSLWPAYSYEFDDYVNQRQADLDDQQRIADAINRVRLTPSAGQLTRMETAVAWPARYLLHRPLLLRVVGRVAMLRARGLEMDTIARRLRRTQARVRIINREALDAIASGLRRDRAPVF